MAGEPVAPKMVQGSAGVRAQIKAKRKPEVMNVAEMGLRFLERYKTTNVITIQDFQKYIPLFNKAKFAAMSDQQKRDLYYDWTQKIDIQHAVYVIDPMKFDEEKGVTWARDNKKHKVIYSLPPKIRRLHQINRLGGNIAALAAEYLANAQSSSNPFDQRGARYSGDLGRIVKLANDDTMKKQNADFKKLHDRAMEQISPEGSGIAPVRESDIAIPQQKDTNNPAGLDAEWE